MQRFRTISRAGRWTYWGQLSKALPFQTITCSWKSYCLWSIVSQQRQSAVVYKKMANHYNTSNKTIAMRGPSLWETRAAFLIVAFYVGKLLVKSVCETAPKSLSCPPPPLPPCTRIWVRALIINFLIKFKGNSKRISGNSLSPRKFQNNDIRELKQGRRRRQRERQKIGEKTRFFVRFSAVTACQRRENALFHVFWGTWTQDDFVFLFLNFDTVH